MSFFGALGDVMSDVINSYNLMTPEENHFEISQIWRANQTNDTHNPKCDKIHTDENWGIIGFIILFLPGILLLPPFLCGAIRNKKWNFFFVFLILIPVYPLTLILLQLLYVFSNFCHGYKSTSVIANIFIGMEAFFEAFGQLVLQGYTILYGYAKDESSSLSGFKEVQIISIGFSFLALSRVAILYDMTMKRVEMTFVESLRHTLEILPCYAFTIIFRVISFSLTIAYLRIYAVIPIGVLLVELFIISYLRYVNVEEISRKFSFVYLAALSNFGVLNVNNFGELNCDEKDHKDDEDGRRFIRRSLTVTFLHHAIVLSVIVILSQTNPDFFEQGSRACIVLKTNSPHFFWIIFVTILVGFQGMLSSLSNAKKVTDVKKENLREEIISTVNRSNDKPKQKRDDIKNLSKITPKPKQANVKQIKGGTLPPGQVHANLEQWRKKRSETLPKRY